MAATLPRKMPAGSRPDSRRRVAVAVGRLDGEGPLDGQQAAEQHGDPEQARGWPGRARRVSGSRANANSTSTSRANGSDLVERRPASAASMRRSLPATSARVTEHGRPRPVRRRPHRPRATVGPVGHVPADDGARSAPASAVGPVELVGGDDHRGARRRGLGARGRRPRRGPSASSPAWGSSSSHSSGRRASITAMRRPPALAGREPGRRPRRGSRPSRPRPAMAASASAGRRLGGPRPEAHVVGHGEVVVEHGGVAEQADPAAHGRGGRCAGRGRAPRRCPTTTGTRPASVRRSVVLPGPVRALEQHDLARGRRRGRRRRAPGSDRGATTAERRWTTGSMGMHRGYLVGRSEPTKVATRTAVDRIGAHYRSGVTFARALGAVGRFMIRAGVLILLFVAYQLWGTGIHTAQAQNDLEPRSSRPQQAEAGGQRRGDATDRPPTPRPTDRGPTATDRPADAGAPPAWPPPEPGQPIGQITIPQIGADFYMVEGVDLKWLKEGPGHFPQHPAARARPATPRSPATARPTRRRSTASTSSSPATRSPSRPCRARSPTRCCPRTRADDPAARRSGHRIVTPDRGRDPRRQGRQPAHPDGLQPEVQRPRSASSSRPSWSATRRPPPPGRQPTTSTRTTLADDRPGRRRPDGPRAGHRFWLAGASPSGSSPGSWPKRRLHGLVAGRALRRRAARSSPWRSTPTFENITRLLPGAY